MSLDIREAKSNEMQIVKDLFLEYARSLDFDLCFQGFDQELATLPGDYAAPAGCLLLALQGQQPVGCVALRRLEGETSEMKRLYVQPASQGRGLGRQLVERLLQKATELGYRKIRLDTVPSMKAANQMYLSMGFQPIPAYRHNPVAGTVYLEKSLKNRL